MQIYLKSKGKSLKAFSLKLETRIPQIHYFKIINMKALAKASRQNYRRGSDCFSGKTNWKLLAIIREFSVPEIPGLGLYHRETYTFIPEDMYKRI